VSGYAGSIYLRVGELSIASGARVETNTVTTGRGGDIQITANSVTINGTGILPNGKPSPSGIFSNSLGEGGGGTISVDAGTISIHNGGTVSAQSSDKGDAGSIEMDFGRSLEVRDGAISTTADRAGGGGIHIQATGQGPSLVDFTNSTIATSVLNDSGDAGNVTIGLPANPIASVVLYSSQVRANAVTGAGGNITISSNVFLGTPDSVVNATASRGISGLVNIESPVSQLSGNFLPLRVTFLPDVQSLRCGTQFAGMSRLVIGSNSSASPWPPAPFPSFVRSAKTWQTCAPSGSPLVPGLPFVGR
jgi:hypothetical protein